MSLSPQPPSPRSNYDDDTTYEPSSPETHLPSPSPSSPPPSSSPDEPTCEFTNPCTTSSSTTTTSSPNTRKVISHIFGRNKTATKLFPSHIWVHYCRKHYQRARYRSAQWPFTQCELLMDSLGRMEVWGGVECFEVVLRRREIMRGEEGVGLDGDEAMQTPSPTPTPTSSPDEHEHEHENAHTDSDSDSEAEAESSETDEPPTPPKRKKPTITPSPVPAWLRAKVGPNKSFNDIRAIIHRIRGGMEYQKKRGDDKADIRFPDIEILPTFRDWVVGEVEGVRLKARRGEMVRIEEVKKGKGKKRVSRVSRRGAVQKIG
ncbi:hypothetical protein MW887_005945 [Aspergillus wentii]|nr:hypothetical protein MW887_005945 [Aspergillus wentii]